MKKKKPPIPPLATDSYLIDTHCHLDMNSYGEDLDQVLLRAQKHGVQSIITIGIDEQSSSAAVELAKKYSMVKATVGVHPHDVNRTGKETHSRLKKLVTENREHIVGYGEIGLDYAKKYSEPSRQRKAFRDQLHIAQELSLPVIIHDREAHKDILEILEETGPFPAGGVMHCFSGDRHLAERVIDLGFFISIPGIVTFKNAGELQEVATVTPIESIILETDGPFLAPAPWRGKRNEPSYLPYIAQQVAELKGITIEEVADKTSCNAQTLFSYDVTI